MDKEAKSCREKTEDMVGGFSSIPFSLRTKWLTSKRTVKQLQDKYSYLVDKFKNLAMEESEYIYFVVRIILYKIA